MHALLMVRRSASEASIGFESMQTAPAVRLQRVTGKGLETISKFLFTVTPAKAGVQGSLKVLDSGFRRNDARRRLVHFEIVS